MCVYRCNLMCMIELKEITKQNVPVWLSRSIFWGTNVSSETELEGFVATQFRSEYLFFSYLIR